MPNTRDIKMLDRRLIVMGVGHNKSGKTCALATMPGKGKIYNFDGPGRMQPIMHMWPDLEVEYDNVGPKKIDHPDPDRCVVSFIEFCKEFESLQDNCPWDWIGIDSFTSFTTTAVNFQLFNRMGVGWNIGMVKNTKGGLPVASWDEFNGEASIFGMVMDVAKTLPCSVWMTAHPITKSETTKEGELIRRYVTLASFGMKVNQIAPGYFTEIWRFEREINLDPNAVHPVSYKVYTQPTTGEGVGEFGSTALPLPRSIDITDRKLFVEIDDILKRESKVQRL